jgi:hypothetical protein
MFNALGTSDTKTIIFSLDRTFQTTWDSTEQAIRGRISTDVVLERLRYEQLYVLAGIYEYDIPVDFFKWARRGRYFTSAPIAGVEVFNYDPGMDQLAIQSITSGGIITDPSKNPDGYDADSIQARELSQKIENSEAIYKIVVCPLPAYLEAGTEDVGRGCHELRHIGRGSSLVISGKQWGAETYYRETVDGVIWVAVITPSILKITASQLGLHCEAYTDGSLVDVFDIVKPS